MGFSTLIDILGSTLIGGMLLLILLRLNDASVENTFTYGGELIVQQNLVSVVELIEHDFRKIGYCKDWEKIPDPRKAILSATDTSISFLTDVAVSSSDLTGDGNVDTLTYFIGHRNELNGTPNPNDRKLYRIVNAGPRKGSNMGITQFEMKYFDALGDTLTLPISNTGAIETMQINITVENSAAYDEKYSSAFWRQIRLAARNLKNR